MATALFEVRASTGVLSRTAFSRELTALGMEFLGTFAIVFFGTGAVAVNQLTAGALGHLGISAVFGAVVLVMVYAGGHISGAHYNPAVSVTFSMLGELSPTRLLRYVGAQVAGGVAASGVLRLCFGSKANLGLTVPTLPAGASVNAVAFTVEFLVTLILMVVIVNCATHVKAHRTVAGAAIALTVFIGAAVCGPLSGGSFNPARTLGPALVDGVYTGLWIYLVAPTLGALLGGLLASAAKEVTSHA